MRRVFNKIFIAALILLSATNIAISEESEYKNSLLKVELLKQNENSYNINLYTQKKFLEPVKVIKKSDLNYYILLPETKNTASQTNAPQGDIRNVSINLYPYAGQDVNNGYTKINIDTTKPINFNINVKQISQNSAQQKQSAIAKQTKPETDSLKEVQKKNQISKPTGKSIASKPAQPAKTTTQKQNKEETKQNKITQPPKKEKQQSAPQKEIKKQEKETPQEIQKEKVPGVLIPEPFENETRQDTTAIEDEESIQNDFENITAQIADESQNNQKTNYKETKNPSFINIIKEKIKKYPSIHKLKEKVSAKFALLGISLKNFIFMISASFFTFIFILFILTRKQNTNIKLQNKKDLFEKYCEPNISKTTTPKKQNRGEYFIFDKNIKQTRLNTPDKKQKNYELSCYDPDLRLNYKKNKNINTFDNTQTQSDSEILRRILKEDSFMDYETEIQTQPIPKQKALKQTAKPKIQKAKTQPVKKPQTKKEAQLNILSSVEIAPQRGFICVSYNNDINLLGYIFDEVFPLYNFKRSKLDNYDIKFRLTDKDDKGANFIVKIDNVKMVIRATKHNMNLEVLI